MGDVGSPEGFVQVAKVRTINGPGLSRSWKDRTDLDSTWKEGKPGLPDIGEVSLQLHWEPDDDDQHEALLTAFQNNTLKRFRLEWPDDAGSFTDFDGYVLSFGGATEVDGDLVRDITIRGTGVPTFG
jgi:hypothetical protein